MKYTDYILKQELIRLVGFSEHEAEIAIETYRQDEKLDDLIDVVKTKQEACSQL